MSQTILVTGASSGIGQATARLLAERGFTVFGTARKPDAVAPQGFTMVALDVRSDESVRDCVAQVLAQAGRLDVLVNNAGYAVTGAAEETSVEEAKAQLDTNFFGAVRMVNAVLPGMRAAGAGKIINISSLAGNTAIPYSAFYSASKFALEGYSESLWYEVRPFGISVSLVEPGFVHTPIGEASPPAAHPLPAYDETRKRVLAAFDHAVEGGIPPEQVARRVLQIVEQSAPGLRYRVGAQGTWLPRARNVVPWNVYAAGVRKTFAV
ncbi:MAG TPA: SDR family NAD(P)-dependent oxidoreductase [Gemmatimonadales bacterium]|jgi:NAD(P)-dependent dehydrogenase (short-subunit alcohol dehydrogenase family)